MKRTLPSAPGVTVASVRQAAPAAPCSTTDAGRGSSAEDDPLTAQSRSRERQRDVPARGGRVAAAPVVNHVERRPSAVRAVPAGTLLGPALPSITSERTRPEG